MKRKKIIFGSWLQSSIFQIDKKLGKKFALQYENDNHLGKISKDILSNKDYLNYKKNLFRRFVQKARLKADNL